MENTFLSKITIVLSIWFFAAGSVSADMNNEASCKRVNETFRVGETVNYTVYYHWGAVWMRAGEVEFEVKDSKINGKDVLHVVASGRTIRRYDWFFKVRDVYETYIQPETMMPLRFKRDIYEGGYTIFSDYKFDRNNNKVAVEHEDWKTPRYKDTLEIGDCTQDVLSAIYYARTLDFEGVSIGDTIGLEIFLEDKLYNVYIRYLGKERIRTEHGRYNCIKFSALLLEGTVFEGGEDMMVWVTDDENRIPVLIEAPIKVGSIKAILTDAKGTAKPIDYSSGRRR
ncbi:MAG: DUF3108 domain-containing protein [Chitinophagaceae bacterium]|nr:MAG: DUF3108 domain-containing protein [Chitinophagaceae bacterium]